MRLRRIPVLDAPEHVFLSFLRHGEAPAGWSRSIHSGMLGNRETMTRVLDMAITHRLAGWLYGTYRDQDWFKTTPSLFHEELRLQYVQTSLLNTRTANEFRKIAVQLNKVGIEPLLLKGAALIADGLEDPGCRYCADLDILVRTAQLDAADRVLQELGYRIDASTQPPDFYRRYHFHYIYRNPQKPWCCLELHWDISVPAMGIRLPIEGWLGRSRRLPTADHVHRIFSPVDFLLHLCLHASLNHFSKLSQIRDIHSLLLKPEWRVDPSEFWTMARYCHISVPAAVCLILARTFGDNVQRELLLSRTGDIPDLSRILSLVDITRVVRRDMLARTAFGRAVSMHRRDRLRDRLSFKLRQTWPAPADFGLDGHPKPTGISITNRFFSWRGFLVLARMETADWLSRHGWEVVADHGS